MFSFIPPINNSVTTGLSFSTSATIGSILFRFNIDLLHITTFYQYLTHDLLD